MVSIPECTVRPANPRDFGPCCSFFTTLALDVMRSMVQYPDMVEYPIKNCTWTCLPASCSLPSLQRAPESSARQDEQAQALTNVNHRGRSPGWPLRRVPVQVGVSSLRASAWRGASAGDVLFPGASVDRAAEEAWDLGKTLERPVESAVRGLAQAGCCC